jgi:cryptochrome
VREFWWRVQDVIMERKKKKKQPVSDIPVNLPGQLLFRDMYFGAQAALGYSFAQEAGNKDLPVRGLASSL